MTDRTDPSNPTAAPPAGPSGADRPSAEVRVGGAPRRRWASIAVGALIVLLAAEVAARSIEPHVPMPDEWASEEIAIKIDQMEDRRSHGQVGGVVIAGSSQSWGLDPQVLIDAGVTDTAYSASLPAGTAKVQRRWLIEEVVPRLHPDVVVWGVSAPDLNERDNALSARYANARATRTGAVGVVDRWLAGRSALVRLRPTLGSAPDLERALREPHLTSPYNPWIGDLGQRVGSTEYAMAPDAPPPPNVGEWEVGYGIDELPTTVQALQREGIEVVLVLLPVPERTIAAFANREADWELTTATLRSIADELGVPLVDGLRDYSGDESFRDSSHLDAEASRALSEDIARALGGDPPEDLAPSVVEAIAPDAPLEPISELSIPRPGWVQVRTDAPLTDLGGTLLTISTRGGGQPERVLVELWPRRRSARLEQLVDGRWKQVALPRTLVPDERTLQVELPSVARADTTSIRIMVSAIGGGPSGTRRLSPGAAPALLLGDVAFSGHPAWELATGAPSKGESRQSTLERHDGVLEWSVPDDDWSDELVLADATGSWVVLTWDRDEQQVVIDEPATESVAEARPLRASAERTDDGWVISIAEQALPTAELDESAGPLTIGPRRRSAPSLGLLAEGLDLVLR